MAWYDYVNNWGPNTSGAVRGPDPSMVPVDSAESNLNAAPYNLGIANLVNAANRAAQKSSLAQRIPQGPQLEELSSENIGRELRGELSQSYLDNLYQNLSGLYGSRGYGVDTPALNAAAMRAIGIDTEKLQAAGQEHLTAALARNPAAPIFDYSKLLMSPAEYASIAASNAALAERAREFDEEMALRSLGGSGRGGGAPRYASSPTETGTYGNLSPILYSTATGTNMSNTPSTPEGFIDTMGSGEVTPLDWGVMPTTEGYMFAGSPEDEFASYENAFWNA